MSPEVKPSNVVYNMPDMEIYKSSQLFSNSVLQQSKANTTWDETDPNCTVVLQMKHKADQIEEMNFKQDLTSDSEAEVDNDAVPVAGPAANQLHSAFQPYRGRLKGLQGQWDKVKDRGSLKEKSEDRGKNRQKKKNGREEKSEKKKTRQKKGNRKVWKIRKKGNTGKRETSSMSKKRHKNLSSCNKGTQEKKIVLASGESPGMMKDAAEILMDMYEKTNGGSIADAVLGPSQVKLLTLLCRKAKRVKRAHRAAHSLACHRLSAMVCGKPRGSGGARRQQRFQTLHRKSV